MYCNAKFAEKQIVIFFFDQKKKVRALEVFMVWIVQLLLYLSICYLSTVLLAPLYIELKL